MPRNIKVLFIERRGFKRDGVSVYLPVKLV